MNTVTVIGAEWCASCKSLKKSLETKGVTFEYVDADVNSELIKKYSIRSLPTTLIKKGDVFSIIAGNKVEDILKQMEG